MGFIIEVILTVKAWQKGYGWKALIPMFITGCVAFGIGFVVGQRGGEIMNAWPLFILLDCLCIATLIVMAAKPVAMGKMEKMPSFKELKALEEEPTARRAISSYGG